MITVSYLDSFTSGIFLIQLHVQKRLSLNLWGWPRDVPERSKHTVRPTDENVPFKSDVIGSRRKRKSILYSNGTSITRRVFDSNETERNFAE